MLKLNDSVEYIDEAVKVFEQVIHDTHPSAMDNISKVSKGEMFVLGYLEKRKTEVTPTEISEAMNSSSARISAILNSLEKKGQIVREVDASNRRNVLVTITPLGTKRVGVIKDKMRESLGKLFAQMGEGDTLEFIRLIKKFGELAKDFL